MTTIDILSTPPLRAASLLWQPRPGVHALTVVCKATFTLRPGECVPAPDADPPNEADDHWNDDERRSLHAASDLVPFKRHVDVLLTGHAHAPAGQAVSSLVARLVVAGIEKSVEVYGDRAWGHDGQIHAAPFTRMSLRWERAAGGPETINPVGVRAEGAVDSYGRTALPNLQPPGFRLSRTGQPIPPVGFGPLAPSWPARRALLHRHAAGWDRHGWAARPLPEDVDAAFFNAAPADQQAREIRCDEDIVLQNLHPDHPRLVTRLPGISPRVTVSRAGGSEALRMRCDTLSIDTDRGVCSLVWRGQVVLASEGERVQVFVSADHAEPAAITDDAATTLVGGVRGGPALPFPAPAEAPRATEPEAVQTMTGIAPPAPEAVLPFQAGSPWSAAAPAMDGDKATSGVRERGEDEGTGTLLGSVVSLGAVLPFGGGAGEEESARAGAVSPAPVIIEEPDPVVEERIAPPVQREEPEAEAPAAAVSPPAMIGPLATAEMAEREAAETEEEAPTAKAEVEAAAAPKADEGLPLEVFPIERCAAIAASMARRPGDRGEILEENELTAAKWEKLSAHWQGEILKETRRGKTGLMEVYDKAYVGRLEEERGEITVEEYARIVVGLERGCVEEVLAEMTVPRGAMLRIQRVWIGETTRSAELAGWISVATETARDR